MLCCTPSTFSRTCDLWYAADWMAVETWTNWQAFDSVIPKPFRFLKTSFMVQADLRSYLKYCSWIKLAEISLYSQYGVDKSQWCCFNEADWQKGRSRLLSRSGTNNGSIISSQILRIIFACILSTCSKKESTVSENITSTTKKFLFCLSKKVSYSSSCSQYMIL